MILFQHCYDIATTLLKLWLYNIFPQAHKCYGLKCVLLTKSRSLIGPFQGSKSAWLWPSRSATICCRKCGKIILGSITAFFSSASLLACFSFFFSKSLLAPSSSALSLAFSSANLCFSSSFLLCSPSLTFFPAATSFVSSFSAAAALLLLDCLREGIWLKTQS